mgnify:FL=1
MKRVESFLGDFSCEEAALFQIILTAAIDIRGIVIDLCNCDDLKLFAKEFISNEKYTVLLL